MGPRVAFNCTASALPAPSDIRIQSEYIDLRRRIPYHGIQRAHERADRREFNLHTEPIYGWWRVRSEWMGRARRVTFYCTAGASTRGISVLGQHSDRTASEVRLIRAFLAAARSRHSRCLETSRFWLLRFSVPCSRPRPASARVHVSPGASHYLVTSSSLLSRNYNYSPDPKEVCI